MELLGGCSMQSYWFHTFSTKALRKECTVGKSCTNLVLTSSSFFFTPLTSYSLHWTRRHVTSSAARRNVGVGAAGHDRAAATTAAAFGAVVVGLVGRLAADGARGLAGAAPCAQTAA